MPFFKIIGSIPNCHRTEITEEVLNNAEAYLQLIVKGPKPMENVLSLDDFPEGIYKMTAERLLAKHRTDVDCKVNYTDHGKYESVQSLRNCHPEIVAKGLYVLTFCILYSDIHPESYNCLHLENAASLAEEFFYLYSDLVKVHSKNYIETPVVYRDEKFHIKITTRAQNRCRSNKVLLSEIIKDTRFTILSRECTFCLIVNSESFFYVLEDFIGASKQRLRIVRYEKGNQEHLKRFNSFYVYLKCEAIEFTRVKSKHTDILTSVIFRHNPSFPKAVTIPNVGLVLASLPFKDSSDEQLNLSEMYEQFLKLYKKPTHEDPKIIFATLKNFLCNDEHHSNPLKEINLMLTYESSTISIRSKLVSTEDEVKIEPCDEFDFQCTCLMSKTSSNYLMIARVSSNLVYVTFGEEQVIYAVDQVKGLKWMQIWKENNKDAKVYSVQIQLEQKEKSHGEIDSNEVANDSKQMCDSMIDRLPDDSPKPVSPDVIVVDGFVKSPKRNIGYALREYGIELLPPLDYERRNSYNLNHINYDLYAKFKRDTADIRTYKDMSTCKHGDQMIQFGCSIMQDIFKIQNKSLFKKSVNFLNVMETELNSSSLISKDDQYTIKEEALQTERYKNLSTSSLSGVFLNIVFDSHHFHVEIIYNLMQTLKDNIIRVIYIDSAKSSIPAIMKHKTAVRVAQIFSSNKMINAKKMINPFKFESVAINVLKQNGVLCGFWALSSWQIAAKALENTQIVGADFKEIVEVISTAMKNLSLDDINTCIKNYIYHGAGLLEFHAKKKGASNEQISCLDLDKGMIDNQSFESTTKKDENEQSNYVDMSVGEERTLENSEMPEDSKEIDFDEIYKKAAQMNEFLKSINFTKETNFNKGASDKFWPLTPRIESLPAPLVTRTAVYCQVKSCTFSSKHEKQVSRHYVDGHGVQWCFYVQPPAKLVLPLIHHSKETIEKLIGSLHLGPIRKKTLFEIHPSQIIFEYSTFHQFDHTASYQFTTNIFSKSFKLIFEYIRDNHLDTSSWITKEDFGGGFKWKNQIKKHPTLADELEKYRFT